MTSADWVSVQIGDVAQVVAGGTPSANDPTNFAAPGEGVAWLTPADLSGYKQKYISHGARDLSEKGYSSSSAKIMPANSLLFTSRAPIGYVAIAQNAIATNQGFKSFVFSSEVDPSYAYHFLKSIAELAQEMGTGTTFKEISGATAKTLPFLLPPLAEQKQIAAKLDELLAQVDTLAARLEAIPQILKRFRQSVLAAAVSGRLTEEWRSEFDFQNSWQENNLSELAIKITDGEHLTPKRSSAGNYLLSARNIQNGRIALENVDFVGDDEFERIRKRCDPSIGDVLLSCSGSVGRVALVDKNDST